MIPETVTAREAVAPHDPTEDTTLGVPEQGDRQRRNIITRATEAASRLGSSQREWFAHGVAEALGEAHNKPTGKDTRSWFNAGRSFVERERGLQQREAGRESRQERRAAERTGRDAAIEAGKARALREATTPPTPPTREEGIAAGIKARGDARRARRAERKTAKEDARKAAVARSAREAATREALKKRKAAAPAAAPTPETTTQAEKTPSKPRAQKAAAASKEKTPTPAQIKREQDAAVREAQRQKMIASQDAALADARARDAFHESVDDALDKGNLTKAQAVALRIEGDLQVKPDDPDSDFKYTPAQLEARLADAIKARADAAGAKASIARTPTPLGQSLKAREDIRKWHKRLRAELSRRGLADVRLVTTSIEDLFERFGEKGAEGRFQRALGQLAQTIEVAHNAKDPLRTLNHEIIHALRAMGVISDTEWEKLATLAQSDRDLMQWVSEAYPDLNTEEQLEEAIAEKFADWTARHSDQAGLPFTKRMMARIKDFFAALKASMTGDMSTAENVMRAIERGAVARRVSNETGGPAIGKFMMAGETTKQANTKSLEEAKRLTKLGVSRDEVWRKTGWIEDVDRNWKFEIDDSKATMAESWKDLDSKTTVKLGDILDHPDLFDAYPELRDMPVTRKPAFFDIWGLTQGWFDGTTINVTPYAQDAQATLLHEIQHAVQAIEGFASGGNSAQFNLADQQNLDLLRQYYDRRNAEDKTAAQTTTIEQDATAPSGWTVVDQSPSPWEGRLDMLNNVEKHADTLNAAAERVKEMQAEVAGYEKDMVALREKQDAENVKAQAAAAAKRTALQKAQDDAYKAAKDEADAKRAKIQKAQNDAHAVARAAKAEKEAATKKVYDDLQNDMRAFISGGGKYSDPAYRALTDRSNAAHREHMAAISDFVTRDHTAEREAREAVAMPTRDYNAERAARDAIPGVKPDYAAQAKEVDAIRDKAAKVRQNQKDLEKQLKDTVEPFKPLAYDLYTLLSGEVEARDTQARKDYDAARREATTPYGSENIKPSERIVTFKIGGSSEEEAPGKFAKARPGTGVNAEDVKISAIKDPPTVSETYAETPLPKGLSPQARKSANKKRNSLAQAADDMEAIIDNRGKTGALHMVGTRDLARYGKKFMPSLPKLIELNSLNHAVAKEFREALAAIKDEFLDLPKKLKGIGPGSANAYMYNSNRLGMWGYQPSYHAEGVAKLDPGLVAEFKAIEKASPKAAAVIKAAFRFSYDALRTLHDITAKTVDAEFDPQIAEAKEAGDDKLVKKLEKQKAEAIKEFSRAFDTQEGKPYTPMTREGDWIVVGKSPEYEAAEEANDQDAIDKMRDDENHLFVDFRDTSWEAKRLAKDVIAKFGKEHAGYFERSSEQANQVFNTDNMPLAFKRMQSAIESEIDKGSLAAKQMKRLATDLYLHSLTTANARKSGLRRENVSARNPRTGEVPHMMKAFISRNSALISYIASMGNAESMRKLLDDVQKEAHGHKDYDVRRAASRVHNIVMWRFARELSKQPNRVVDAISAGTSIWMLQLSPAYHLTNAMQTGVSTQPILAAKWGYPQSAFQLARGYRDFEMMTRGTGVLDPLDLSKAPADVREMLNYVADDGMLDAGLSGELSHWEMNGDGLLPSSWNKVDKFLRNFPKRIEVMNRSTAAMAAYRLARQPGRKQLSHEDAMRYASEIVEDTHGDYSGWNAPSAFHLMGGSVGKISLQFRKFQGVMIRMLGKEMKRTFTGATREEKLQGALAVTYTVMHMLAVGGIRAVPLVGLIGWAAMTVKDMFDDDDDDDWKSWAAELRELLGAGKDGVDRSWWADMLEKGIPAAMGVDMSQRLGMGNTFALAPFVGLDDALTTPAKMMEKGGELVFGATGGVAAKAVNGWGFGVDRSAYDRWWQGIEGMFPAGPQGVSKAIRLSQYGLRNMRGDVQIPADQIKLSELILTALSLTPSRFANRSEQGSELYEATQFHANKTTMLKGRYARAVASGDEDAIQQAEDAFEKEQLARERDGFTRQSKSVLTSAVKEKAKREASTIAGVQTTKANRGFREKQTQLQDAEP